MVIGIDIGTVYVKACLVKNNGETRLVKIANGNYKDGEEFLLPSAALFKSGEFVLGNEALAQKVESPDRFIAEFKNEFGRDLPYHVDGQYFCPDDIYKAFFSYLRQTTESSCDGEAIATTHLSYPSYFNENKRNRLKSAAERAGLVNITLVSETLAAAKHYLLENKIKGDQVVLVFDFGGASVCAALIKYASGQCRQLVESVGTTETGGMEIDRLLYQYLSEKCGLSETLSNHPDDEAFRRRVDAELSQIVEKAKYSLANSHDFECVIDIDGQRWDIGINRNEFNQLVTGVVETAVNFAVQVVNDAGITFDDVSLVLPIGGSSSIPLVRERLSQLLNRKSILTVNPLLATVLGTATWSVSLIDDNYDSKVCKNCKQLLAPNLTYCVDCGHIMYYPDYILDDMKEQYKKSIELFLTELKGGKQLDARALIDATVARYAQSIQDTVNIMGYRTIQERVTKDSMNEMSEFLQRCVSGEFHMAIIGTIKAGKSTLINALLGRDLASTNVIPETAALTKFRASADKDFVRVSFYSRQEWTELWQSVEKSDAAVFKRKFKELNAVAIQNEWIDHAPLYETFNNEEELRSNIKDWTSATSAKHYFVKEVEIGLVEFSVAKEVVIVDTPGLDDPVDYRSDITRKYIKRANMVAVCIIAKRMLGQEMEILFNVFANTRYNPAKVYVLGTQLDGLNSIKKDWAIIEGEWLQLLEGNSCFGTTELAKSNLIPVAAYQHRLLTKLEVDEVTEDEYFDVLMPFFVKIMRGRRDAELKDPAVIDELKTITNLETVRQRLMETELSRARKIIVQDIVEKYKQVKAQLNPAFETIRSSQTELLYDLNAGVERMQERAAQLNADIRANEEKKEKINQAMSVFTRNVEGQVEELIDRIKAIRY